jgi:NAD(P)-dependent dehydrogenase (short-subunit alcohol dehydrogenase family)
MKDKIILITGATSGIGKAAAIALASQGATVIVHGRNEQKTRETQKEIINHTGNDRVDVLVADLFSLAQTRKMAAAFREKYNRLDVLINNAGGIMGNDREVTSEGYEKTIAVNLLSPFLLTKLLMPDLKKSVEGRVINVSSSSHRLNAKPDFEDIQLINNYNPMRAYGNAKLFLIMITQYWTKQLAKDPANRITLNSMHPGAVHTNFGVDSDLGRLLNFLGKVARPFFKSVEEGADTIDYLATSVAVKGVSGLYFVNRKPAEVSQKYMSPEYEQIVWDFCENATG